MRVYFEDESESNETFENILKTALELVGQNNDKIVVDVRYVDENKIKEINAFTRGVDKVTDVLSFPLIDNPCNQPIDEEHYPFDVDFETGEILLGDIVICKDVAKKQAEEYGHSYERELAYLFTHAVFHLLGFDHIKEEDKAIMRKSEEAVLSKLGITRD